MTETAARSVLIGRERELGAIRSSLAQARDKGQNSTILLHGEPGIGKTRLVAEAMALAKDEGMLVAAGQCDELAGAVAFEPLRDALAGLAYDARLANLMRRVGEASPELTTLVPELRSLAPEIQEAEPISPLNEEYRLFESAVRLLTAAAGERKGLLLCIEDIHWADDSSLALLRHLGRRLTGPVVLVCSYRDTETDTSPTLQATVESLMRYETTQTIGLNKWNREAIRDYLATRVRPFPPPGVVDTVQERSGGNPFFAKELVQNLLTTRRLLDGHGAWQIELDLAEGEVPGDALLIAGAMLRPASESCREALLAAAIAGRGFDFDTLLAVSDLAEDTLIVALDEAVRLRLVEGIGATIRFSHELVRQALLHDVSPPRREQLHERVARSIQARATAGEAAADIAYHLYHAGSRVAGEEVASSAKQAGEEALAVFAHADALRLFSMAIERLEQVRDHDRVEMARLRALRGEALFFMARHQDARPDFEMAAAALPDDERIEVLIPLALASIWSEDVPEAQKIVAEATQLIEAKGREDLRPALELVDAYCETNYGNLTQANERFREGMRLAEGRKRGAHTRLLTQFPLNLYWTGQFQDAIERGQSAVSTALEVHDRSELSGILPSLGLALAASGRYREAFAAFADGRQAAVELENEIHKIAAVSKAVGVHISVFDYKGARSLGEQVYGPSKALEHYPYPAISSGIDLMLIAAREHDIARADEVLEAVAQRITTEHSRHGWLWRMRLAAVRAEVEVARGDLNAALGFAESGLELSQKSGRPKYQALSLEARGNALLRLGRRDEALDSLRGAVAVARATGDPAMFLRAATELLAAEFDNALLDEADAAVARIQDNLPEEMVAGFDASDPVQLVRSLLDGAPRESHAALPAGLSQREYEVLLLLAGGRSNQQIAEALVLSVRTVERHINHVYTKLDVHSRSQATAFVLREGLMPL